MDWVIFLGWVKVLGSGIMGQKVWVWGENVEFGQNVWGCAKMLGLW